MYEVNLLLVTYSFVCSKFSLRSKSDSIPEPVKLNLMLLMREPIPGKYLVQFEPANFDLMDTY